MAAANVSHFVPPPPPGPATFDRSKFRQGGTLLVDTQNLEVNANLISTCRLKAYGDPANPLAPVISTPSIATNILFAPSFDAANNVQFRAVAAFSNSMIQFTTPSVMSSNVTIGSAFNWTPPTFSTLQNQSLTLTGGNLGQTYPLMGGQVRGYAKLFVPQPQTVPSVGTLYNLNGGVVGGQALLYR